MADGLFPWRNIFRLPEQEVRSRESLPPAPEGTEWVLKENQWTLEKKQHPETSRPHPPIPVSPCSKTVLHCVDKLPMGKGAAGTINNNSSSQHSSGRASGEEDWEFLSDRVSATSTRRTGSVRSLDDQQSHNNNSTTTTLSVPFKIQRTASSSTIDSSDGALGPSGKGVLGVDYVEHVILPTDTLQGICLEYKISTTKLRQANHFSGHSLLLAPKKLVIPISKTALRSGFIRVQDTASKEYKLHAFLAEFPDIGVAEAKA